MCSDCNIIQCSCPSRAELLLEPDLISNQVENEYNYSENTMSSTCISLNSLPRQLKVSPVPQISSYVNSGHSSDIFIHTQEHPHSLNLDSKGINIGDLNIQGFCGENMSKFSELKLLLTARENCNLHILGLSEIKDHMSTEVFKVDGFQTPFSKIITLMVVEV